MRTSILILMGALLAVSVSGYLIPEKQEVLPDRILMQNTGGRVVFDHKTHMEKYGIECARCHHESPLPGNNESQCYTCHSRDMGKNLKLSCKTCHDADFEGDFKTEHISMSGDKTVCATCHHTWFAPKDWNHDAHATRSGQSADTACADCHHQDSREPVPANCAECHTSPGTSSVPSLKDAVHSRCMSCHAEQFKSGPQSCTFCHSRVDMKKEVLEGKNIKHDFARCSTCHTEAPSKLIPKTMAAYHGLCIGCHKEQGGPVDNCGQCHRK